MEKSFGRSLSSQQNLACLWVGFKFVGQFDLAFADHSHTFLKSQPLQQQLWLILGVSVFKQNPSISFASCLYCRSEGYLEMTFLFYYFCAQNALPYSTRIEISNVWGPSYNTPRKLPAIYYIMTTIDPIQTRWLFSVRNSPVVAAD